MNRDPRRVGGARLPLASLFCLAFCLFAGLAAWQVERRAWKHALIDRVSERVRAAPIDAPGVEHWTAVSFDGDEYRHVRASGSFLFDRATFVQAATALGSGYWMIVPLLRGDGTVVLVNRGFVSSDDRARVAEASATQPAAQTVTGLLRSSEPSGRLYRNDPAAGRWMSRDVDAIARARGLQRVAPYFVDADAGEAEDWNGPRTRPVGGLTVVAFSDNHLLYAMVWSALALLCVGAMVLLFRMPAR